MYACGSGGGNLSIDHTLHPEIHYNTVTVDPIKTPGIPGAPSQPDNYIYADDLIKLANQAFDAALKDAQTEVCNNPCDCKAMTVTIVCTGPLVTPGLEDGDLEDMQAVQRLCGRTQTVTCPNAK